MDKHKHFSSDSSLYELCQQILTMTTHSQQLLDDIYRPYVLEGNKLSKPTDSIEFVLDVAIQQIGEDNVLSCLRIFYLMIIAGGKMRHQNFHGKEEFVVCVKENLINLAKNNQYNQVDFDTFRSMISYNLILISFALDVVNIYPYQFQILRDFVEPLMRYINQPHKSTQDEIYYFGKIVMIYAFGRYLYDKKSVDRDISTYQFIDIHSISYMLEKLNRMQADADLYIMESIPVQYPTFVSASRVYKICNHYISVLHDRNHFIAFTLDKDDKSDHTFLLRTYDSLGGYETKKYASYFEDMLQYVYTNSLIKVKLVTSDYKSPSQSPNGCGPFSLFNVCYLLKTKYNYKTSSIFLESFLSLIEQFVTETSPNNLNHNRKILFYIMMLFRAFNYKN